MKINMIKKIMLALVVTALSSCGGGGDSQDSGQDPSKDTGKESKNYSYIPDTLETGETCYPLKINNKSKVLLTCSKAGSNVIAAIWSEEEGLKFLPGEVPQVYATEPSNLKLLLYPKDLSDDGKVFFDLLQATDSLSSFVTQYNAPDISYVHDGEKYIPFEGVNATVSPNGEYIVAYVNSESKYNIYKNFKKIELPDLSALGDIYQINGINNDGVVVGTTYYSDIERSYSSNYAVTFSKDGARLLPPPNRPDKNSNQAQSINSNGDILMLVYEALDKPVRNSIGDENGFRNRLYIVKADDSFEELFPGQENNSNYGFSISDNQTVIFNQIPLYTDLPFNTVDLIYQKDKGVIQVKDAIDLKEGEAYEWSDSRVNNKNEIIVYVTTESGSKARIAKIK